MPFIVYLRPIVDVTIGSNKDRISVLVDTSCTTGICFLKEQVKNLDIGARISDEYTPCSLADGTIVAGEDYYSWVEVNGEKQVVTILVIDPNKRLGYETPDCTTPLLGRMFMDHYKVVFDGHNRKIALFNSSNINASCSSVNK